MKKCFLLEVVKLSPKILPLLFPITTAASRFWLRLEGTSMKAIGGRVVEVARVALRAVFAIIVKRLLVFPAAFCCPR